MSDDRERASNAAAGLFFSLLTLAGFGIALFALYVWAPNCAISRILSRIFE